VVPGSGPGGLSAGMTFFKACRRGALSNKTARIAWAMLARGDTYRSTLEAGAA
jgi:hypothetical protein